MSDMQRASKWHQRLSEWKAYHSKNVHANCNRVANKKLSNWIRTQRTEYRWLSEGKPSHMTQERITLLEQAGFIWSVVGWRAGKSDKTVKRGAQGTVDASAMENDAHSMDGKHQSKFKARRINKAKIQSKKFAYSKHKPVFENGDQVVAPYWPPDNSSTIWISAIVMGRTQVGTFKYGPIWKYNLRYENQATCDHVEDYFVMSQSDYNLMTMKEDGHTWLGVKNVQDKHCRKDKWACLVGWYEVQIDGQKWIFSSLSDALRAYDKSVVAKKGRYTKRADLNIAEEWVFSRPLGLRPPIFAGVEEGKVRPSAREDRSSSPVDKGTRESVSVEECHVKERKSKRKRPITINLTRSKSPRFRTVSLDSAQGHDGDDSSSARRRGTNNSSLSKSHSLRSFALNTARQLDPTMYSLAGRKGLKPVLEIGDEVMAVEVSRRERNSNEQPIRWRPGKVIGRRRTGNGDDEKYGCEWCYDVMFRDGSVLRNIDEVFVRQKREYAIASLKENGEEWNYVRRVTDDETSDKWAKNVGWYAAFVNGKEYHFSSIADALCARDSFVVEMNGKFVEESQLNVPEDWKFYKPRWSRKPVYIGVEDRQKLPCLITERA